MNADLKMAPACQPLNRYSRHRFHWVKGNDFECWEWSSSGIWWRQNYRGTLSAEEAGKQGWTYWSEAHPPKDQ